jgi:hypothetical protein
LSSNVVSQQQLSVREAFFKQYFAVGFSARHNVTPRSAVISALPVAVNKAAKTAALVIYIFIFNLLSL